MWRQNSHKLREDAEYAAYLIRRNKGLLMEAYRCRFCRHRHVEHTAGQRMREKLRRLFLWSPRGESGGGNPGRGEH